MAPRNNRKLLLIGSGGREHALAWRLTQDDPSLTVIAAPGNPGIAEVGRCVAVPAADLDGLAVLARDEAVDLTVVGPEAPLAAGIVDRFRAEGLPAFGPTAAAAEIETSKAFSKALMRDAGVPTAAAVTCTTLDDARRAVRDFGAPVVVKASGLAAGKGVIVCPSIADADAAVGAMLADGAFGDAGRTVLVEEFMSGEELSLFVLTDGARAVPLVPSQDHKRLLPGDEGPNTGGMGAYAPVSLAEGIGGSVAASAVVQETFARVIQPTLDAMRDRGIPFTGLLYAGLMLTSDGPKVVEFNCRFGDPETQAVLPVTRLGVSLLELMLAIARGDGLPDDVRSEAHGHAVTTVLASRGYPENPRTGDPITLPPSDPDSGILVFHAGTRREENGSLVTGGGRVLAVTGTGGSFEEAQRRSSDFAARVAFAGKQYRPDIGWRELARSHS